MKKAKKAKAFDERLYKNVSFNDLILFGIYSVIQNKEKCTFERLVRECFALFPRAFSFPRYSRWPDSRKFDRPLRTLRERGLIIGSPRTSFSFTESGEKIAEETVKALKQGKLL